LEQAKHRVLTCYPCQNVSNMDYLENFQVLVGMVETYGRTYRQEPGLIWAHLVAKNVANPDKPSPIEPKAAEKACCEENLSCMFLRGADQIRYYQLKNELANDMAKGSNNYPKSLVVTDLQSSKLQNKIAAKWKSVE
jgi:hypothetical protein